MFRMTVQDVFFIRNRGLVATGRVEHGELRVGDEVRINEGSAVRVDAIGDRAGGGVGVGHGVGDVGLALREPVNQR